MVRDMRQLCWALVAALVVIAAFTNCGGHEAPYQIDVDAGCLIYSGTGDYCTLSPYACDASPDVGKSNLTTNEFVKCDNHP